MAKKKNTLKTSEQAPKEQEVAETKKSTDKATFSFPVYNYGKALEKHEAIEGNKKKKKDPQERSLRLADETAPFNYVEAYKSLRTNLSFISSAEEINSIVVTSAVPRESKSNVAINICTALASEGKRVIMVDCDLRKPAVHSYLHMDRNTKGVTDVLSGSSRLDESVVYVEDLGFFVLPAGTIPPNPSEMLAQDKMKKIIEKLKEIFDFVILDAPPISIVTDAAVLGKYVDGAVLVVRSKFASREAVQLAKKKLTDVDVKILGAVLTRYDAKTNAKSGYYSYGYDNYGYGYGYGYGYDQRGKNKDN